MSKTVCVDLDGTLTLGDHSLIHYLQMKPDYKAIAKVNDRKKELDADLIVYTARPKWEHGRIANWLEENGVDFDALICGKVQADEYIDNNSKRVEEI